MKKYRTSLIGRIRGFSLIELLVTISVMAILLTIVAPSFVTFLINSRLTSAANDLATDFSFARGEASSRGLRVVVCPATSNTACSSSVGDWSVGRLVFVDANANGTFDSGDTLLKYVSGIKNVGFVANDSNSNPITSVAYMSYGGVLGARTMTFKLCSPAGSGGNGRFLVVGPTGRSVITKINSIASCP